MPKKTNKTKSNKPGYVDGFVLPLPIKNIAAYRTMAKKAGEVWKKYGALDYKECIGDDLSPEGVKMLFPRMVTIKKGETVVFAYIVFKSRAHRDAVNAKVMKDPFMDDPKYKDKPMPFDLKRMAYAGFKILVDVS